MIFNKSKFNNHWQTKSLTELGSFNRGKSKHRPRNDKTLFENGDMPLIQTGDVKNSNFYIYSHSSSYNKFGLSQSKLWKKGTLCITIAANIAETAILGYDMCFPDSIVGFNAFKEECSEVYMHYIFSYIRESIQNRIQGSIQDNINIEYLKSLKFKIPEKFERQKIAKVLSDLDAKIEVNNKINQELETMAKTLYDYWFVQFDFPFDFAQGKPNENGKPYKSSGGKMVYNDVLKREIPEGWEVKKLGDLESNIVTGKTPSTKVKENFGGNIPFITIDDIRKNKFIYQTERTLSKLGAETQKKKYLEENDICISCIGTVGVIGFVGTKSQSNQQINTISTPNPINRYFLYHYLSDYFNFNSVAKKGAILSNMNKGEFEAIPVLNPQEKLKKEYLKKVDNLFKLISNNIKENQKLSALRDWLLPMLMNGQVTIGEEKKEQPEENILKMTVVKPIDSQATNISVHIIKKLENSPGMGRTKLQKVLHLAQYKCEKDLGGQYLRNTAGPYNDVLLNHIESKFNTYGLIRRRKVTENGKPHYIYSTTSNTSVATNAYKNSVSEKIQTELDKLLEVVKPLNLKETEAISTLYAVWNNRLIQNQEVNNNLLFKDFYNWSKRKREVFNDDDIKDALNTMRLNNIIPTGWGEYIGVS